MTNLPCSSMLKTCVFCVHLVLCIKCFLSTNEQCSAEECLPMVSGRQFRTIFVESKNGSSRSYDPLPPDCWKVCLQYLSSPLDIGRFRLVSKKHNQIYYDMMKLIITDFQYIFSNYSGRTRYSSNQNIERAIPLIPCGSIDFDDDEQYSASSLWHFHSLSKNDIVRGLECYSGLSFLSIFLRRDVVRNNGPKEHVLLICLCGHDGFQDVRLYRLLGNWDHAQLRYFPFDLQDLHVLLQREYVVIDEFEDGVWTMESRGKQLKRKFLEKCIRLSRCGVRPFNKFRKWVNEHPHAFWAGYAVFVFTMFFVFTYGLLKMSD